MGIQPRHLHVDHRPGIHLQEEKHDVLDAGLYVALAVGRHADGSLLQQVQGDRHIVGPEAPQGVLVRSNLSQVRSLTVEVIDRPQLARRYHLPQVLYRRVEYQKVTDHDGNACFVHQTAQIFRLLHRQRHRFFNQDRQAAHQHLPRYQRMGDDGRGHDDAVDAVESLVQ